MVRLMAGLEHLGLQGIKLQLRPEWVEGEKLQMICGVAPAHKPKLTTQVSGKLPFGVPIEWKGEQRLLQTGKPDLQVEVREGAMEAGRQGSRGSRWLQAGEGGHRSKETGDQASGQASAGAGVGRQASGGGGRV